MIWQMDLLLILLERQRMPDGGGGVGGESKGNIWKGDSEEGCVKGLGCQTIHEDRAKRNHYDCVTRESNKVGVNMFPSCEYLNCEEVRRRRNVYFDYFLNVNDPKKVRMSIFILKESDGCSAALENSNFALTNPIRRGRLCSGVELRC